MERRELLTIFTVLNNGDAGTGSLRSAINSANSNPGTDTIRFNLPNTQLVIAPLTPLPTLTDPGTVIDATSQSNYNPTNGRPVVILSGAQLPANNQGSGLAISGGAGTIKGFVIDNFGGSGIRLSGSPGDLVQDCYIGTSANGLAVAANGGNGIDVGTSSCTIGGTGVAQRNVISGNSFGINVTSNKTTILGNYIGVGADGATVVANVFDGVELSGSVGNQVGGFAAGAGNVISGNGDDGVFIFTGGSTGDTIQGNFIGTDATGTLAAPNGDAGVYVQGAANVTIGGTGAAGNVISANANYGIFLLGTNTKNISIAGNKIGVGADGTAVLPNKVAGIWVEGANNSVIGGTAVTLGNIIANNGTQGAGPGIEIQSGTSVEILSNSIHDNTSGGIFLSQGANGDLAAPSLTLARTAAGQTEIAGSINVDPASGAGDNFVIQFFDNTSADAGGKFEGQTLIGQTTVTADIDGGASFDVRLPVGVSVGDNITATTTQQVVQNTSEFSAPIVVAPAPTTNLIVTVSPNLSPDLFGTDEIYTVTIQNAGTNDDPNVVYTGSIDNNSTYISSSSSQGTAPTFATNLITADLGTIAAGQSATVTIEVSPNAVGTISLTSTAVGDVIDTIPNDNTAVVTPVVVNPAADVSVTINSNPNPVAAGQPLTFVITVVNSGPSVATGVTVIDTLPLGFSNFTIDPGDGSIASENGNVITFDLGDLPVGGSNTITISGSAPTTAGPVTDSATANSDTVADPHPDNNQFTTPSVYVENAVNLGLSVKATPTPASTNKPLAFTITVSNATDPVTGLVPSAATGVVLTDTLPTGIDPNQISVVPSQGTFTILNGVVTVNFGTIAPNGTPPTVVITVVPLSSGNFVNKATIKDTVEINVGTANTTVVTTVPSSPSDIAVKVTANPGTATLGQPLTYTVTVTNNGPADAPATVAADTLAAGLAIKSIATSQGTFAVAGQKITFNLGTLASGKSATLTIVAVPPSSAAIGNTAGASSGNLDTNQSNNVATIQTFVSPADLVIGGGATTSTPIVGDPFAYGFTVFNAGPSVATNAYVNLPLPAGDAYVESGTTQGFTALSNGVLIVGFGNIPVGGSATFHVTLIPTIAGVQKATVSTGSVNIDPNLANNAVTVTTTSSALPGTFALSAANYSGNENAGSIPITINRVNGTLGAVDVSYFTVDATAKAGTNYTTTAGSVRFAAGQTSATINVPVKDDGVITGNLGFYFGINGVDNGGKLGAQTAAAVTVINTDRDFTPPEVLSVVPIEGGGGVAAYVIDFSKPLDPTHASNAANYTIFASGRDAGTGNVFIAASATYDASANAVIVVPSHPLALNAFYGLMINGATSWGVMDTSGNLLDGTGGGVAGGTFGSYIGIGNSLTYVDSGGNLVNLAAANATLLMERNFAGDPYEVEILGDVPGRTVLGGSVRRLGAGSTGVTGIGEIDGLGPFGSVNTNQLTSPPIFVSFSNFTASLPVPQSIQAAESVGQLIPNGPRYVLARLKARG